jgi:hypothetical protein
VSAKSFTDYAQQVGRTPLPPHQVAGRKAKARPGTEDRPTLTLRLDQARWERLKKLAIDERTTVQAILETAVEAAFKKRGLPW